MRIRRKLIKAKAKKQSKLVLYLYQGMLLTISEVKSIREC
jgi:hypothetical protein